MTLERKISLRWEMLNRCYPEDSTGNRPDIEKFKLGLDELEKMIYDQAVATVKDRTGELCFVVAINEGIYLDDREWLAVTYIKPSHGFSPYDWYCGSWLPVGIKLR